MGHKVDTYDGKGNLLSSVDTRTDEDLARIEAQAWLNFREQRNSLLHDTDWISNKAFDNGTAISDEWKTYRQALRDLPANTDDPTDVTWPTKPS